MWDAAGPKKEHGRNRCSMCNTRVAESRDPGSEHVLATLGWRGAAEQQMASIFCVRISFAFSGQMEDESRMKNRIHAKTSLSTDYRFRTSSAWNWTSGPCHSRPAPGRTTSHLSCAGFRHLAWHNVKETVDHLTGSSPEYLTAINEPQQLRHQLLDCKVHHIRKPSSHSALEVAVNEECVCVHSCTQEQRLLHVSC